MAEPIHRYSLKPGYRLHWYSIGKVLGQGGFGITYLAHDSNLDQEVAIKEYLPIELAVRERDLGVQPAADAHRERFQWGLDRFMAEAQTLARFKHPNIVRVLAVFEANRTGYMVMEYEEGDSLKDILTCRQTLEEAELLNIVLPILGGLEKVHERGFIHRDIKPANIFIRDDGSPVLIDFGSARQALGTETRTLTTLVSPGYAPFEQYYSKGEQQGPWTDIYGLGATLYRAVTGRPPEDALQRSLALHEATRDSLVGAGEIAKGRYSGRFLKAIDHALQFRQKDRPQTVAEWRREFAVVPDTRPDAKALDSAMMAATIVADEPHSPPMPPAVPSVARRAVPDVQAVQGGMVAKAVVAAPRGIEPRGRRALWIIAWGLVVVGGFAGWRLLKPPLPVTAHTEAAAAPVAVTPTTALTTPTDSASTPSPAPVPPDPRPQEFGPADQILKEGLSKQTTPIAGAAPGTFAEHLTNQDTGGARPGTEGRSPPRSHRNERSAEPKATAGGPGAIPVALTEHAGGARPVKNARPPLDLIDKVHDR